MKMYHEFAPLWSRLSPPSAYARLARRLRALARGESVLHLGSGGGHLLSHLKQHFRATAVDLAEPMLEESRRLNPDVSHVRGDLRAVRLGARFSTVLATDALDYLLTPAEVGQALETMAAHVEPGGTVLLAPNYVRETFPGKTLHHFECGSVDVLEWTPAPAPGAQQVETLFLFIRRGEGLSVEPDLHRMSLFPKSFWLEQLERIELAAKVHGRMAPEQGALIFQGVFRTGG